MLNLRTFEQIKAEQQQTADGLITLRSEQRDAIDHAKERFCTKSGRQGAYQFTIDPKYRQFLWNAKMRFGKTICAMQLMRELDVKRTLIITHRPVVGESWLQAFKQVVGSKNSEPKVKGNSDIHNSYGFGMRSVDDSETVGNYYDLEKFVETPGNHYAFFVSMQYIRLSELVNSKTQAKNAGKNHDNGAGDSTSAANATSAANEKLKADILKTDWDLIIIDEAHEGTLTSLGSDVFAKYLKKDKTKMLYLSGTPFNLFENFDPDKEVFTWDYIAEQTAKHNWTLEHPDEKNPYAELPKMNIFTYDITKNIDNVLDQTGVFTFQEFFRTWTGNPRADKATMPDGAKGRFVHEQEMSDFLNLLCKKDAENNFPFSTDEYRRMFRHTLWVVSHVNEAAALEQLLKEHKIFRRFKIVNVAGKSDADEQNENALDKVLKAIGDKPETTSTITISCGRLTTGVTVAPWTAVFYLKGGDRAATYMQTIFRVQSPYKTPDGKIKKECYVFDFAPDRTLKIVAETAKFSSMATAKKKKEKEGDEEKTQEMRDKETVRDFIELCPVLSMEGGQMSPMDVGDIYKQLENVFIDRLVRKGFDDDCLYNQTELNKLDPTLINEIGKHGGQAPDEKRKDAKEIVDLSHMTEEQRTEWEEKIRQKKAEAQKKAEEKLKKEEEFKKKWETMSDEEREEWLKQEAERIAKIEKARKEREEFKKRTSNIRGIALRIPLLMYGGADRGDAKDDLTVENFTRKIKDESWTEFMPKGISKEDFNKIRKCFNATRFEEAGKKYRALTREADFMHIDERIHQITEIFSYFRNPDKETVLTPWRVVNMHMSDTIGGWCWYDESFDEKTRVLDTPHYVEQGDVTRQLFANVDLAGEVQTKILEINSKTGLYPLYVTYSLFRRRLYEYIKQEVIKVDKNRLKDFNDSEWYKFDYTNENISVQEEQVVWDDIVKDNMYVICNTPMAVGITRRTLFGFRQVDQKANIKNVQLIERASKDQEGLVRELKSVGFWKGNSSKQEMKFNAVVGNPPYMLKQDATSDTPIYHQFMELGFQLSPLATFITPGRFLFDAGKTPKEFNSKMLNDDYFKVVRYEPDSTKVFDKVDIKGGIAITMHNTNMKYGRIIRFTSHDELHTILKKVIEHKDFESIDKLIYLQNKFNLTELYKDYPEYKTIIGSNGREKRLTTSIFNQLDVFSSVRKNEDDLEIIGLINNNRVYRYISKKYIEPHENLYKFKVVLPASNGSGAIGEVLSTPILGYTQSFIGIGAFDTKLEADAALKYVKTKFMRTMLGILKVTQHNHTDVWKFVPLQDFTSHSDIDWSQNIANIDRQLYAKYHLTDDEIAFIEKMIKPME